MICALIPNIRSTDVSSLVRFAFESLFTDKIGLHRISNQSHTIPAVSLHLYSPPYEECHSFDELSGAARASGKMTFYSRGGVKVPAEQR